MVLLLGDKEREKTRLVFSSRASLLMSSCPLLIFPIVISRDSHSTMTMSYYKLLLETLAKFRWIHFLFIQSIRKKEEEIKIEMETRKMKRNREKKCEF